MDLGLVVTVKQVTQCQFGSWRCDLRLEEVEDVVGPAVNDGDADVVVRVVRIRRLIDFGAARGYDVGRVESRVHGIGLAGVDHEEHFVVAADQKGDGLVDLR